MRTARGRSVRRFLGLLALLAAPLSTGIPSHAVAPEVFRAVLDGRPRAVVVHLGSGVWLGWDAERCAPYKLWHGAVALEGAVYDTQHGPTPGSVGRTLWLDSGAPPFPGTSARPRFLGYRIRDDGVELRCRVGTESGSFEVTEVSSVEFGPSGAVRWRRDLEAVGELPASSGSGALRWSGWAFGAVSGAPADEPLDLGWGALERVEIDHDLVPGNQGLELTITPAAIAFDTPEVEERPQRGTRLANLVTDPAARVDHALGYSAYPYGGFQLDHEPVGPARSAYGPVDLVLSTPSDATPRPLVRHWIGEATENLQAGPVGMAIRVGPEPVTVHGLGRVVLAGNRGEAGIRLTDERGRLLAETRVAFADGEPGEMLHATLETPVVLAPGTRAHVLTDQAFGGNVLHAPGLIGPAAGADPVSASAGNASGLPLHEGASVSTERGYWLRVWKLPRPVLRANELIPGQLPNLSQVVPRPAIPDELGISPPFLASLDGYIDVGSGEGARLSWESEFAVEVTIDGEVVEGQARHLAPGTHRVQATALVGAGPARFAMTLNGAPVDLEAAHTRAGVVRITAPGTKRVTPLEWDFSELGLEGVAMVVFFAWEEGSSWFRRNVLGEATEDGRSIVYDVGGKLSGVHPSFDVTTIRPEAFQPKVGGMAFLPDGRLAISCWEPEGGVYVLDGVQPDDEGPVAVRRVAHGLLEPLGLAAVDGDLVVLQKPELTRLIDHDGDGVTDEYRALASEWGVTQNFHEFAFGLAQRGDFLHGTLATAINPGGPSSPNQHLDRGRVFRVDTDGERFEFLAAGLRTPNGIGPGPDGALYVADNQGDWLPASKIVRVEKGAFYGNRSVDPEGTRGREETPPVFWLPQFEIGNSPSQVGSFPAGTLFEGQLLWGDVTHGGLKRGFVERVAGVEQGAVFRFTQGLEAGVNRFTWGPDGSLYVGGVGSTGNWNQLGKSWFGLERLTPNGAPAFEPVAVRAKPGGFEVELSESLGPGATEDPEDFEVVQWRYQPTAAYGGPKVDEKPLEIRRLEIASDRRRVRIDVEGLVAGSVVYLALPERWRSRAGRALWTHETWYTLNALALTDSE